MTELDYSYIGKRIRECRKELKLTQEKLAELSDLSLSYTGAVERGEKIPSLEAFIRIANALQVSSDRLLADVLIAGSRYVASDLYEKLSALSNVEQRRILNVMKTMIADCKTK